MKKASTTKVVNKVNKKKAVTSSPLEKLKAARARSAKTQGTSTAGGDSLPKGVRPPAVKPLQPRPEPTAKEETKVTETVTKVTKLVNPPAAAKVAPTPTSEAAATVAHAQLLAQEAKDKAEAKAKAEAEEAERQRIATVADTLLKAKAKADAEQADKILKAKIEAQKAPETTPVPPKPPAPPKEKPTKDFPSKEVAWFSVLKWVAIALFVGCLFLFSVNWWNERRQASELEKMSEDPVTLPEPAVIVNKIKEGVKSLLPTPAPKVTPPKTVTPIEPIESVESAKSGVYIDAQGNTAPIIIGDNNTIGCCGSGSKSTKPSLPELPKAWYETVTPDGSDDILDVPLPAGTINAKVGKLLLPGNGGTVYRTPVGGWKVTPRLVNILDHKFIEYAVDIGTLTTPKWVDPAKTDKEFRAYWIRSKNVDPIEVEFQLEAPKQ